MVVIVVRIVKVINSYTVIIIKSLIIVKYNIVRSVFIYFKIIHLEKIK